MKKMIIVLLTALSLPAAFATSPNSAPNLSQEARDRILKKVVAAIEEETQAKCTEFTQHVGYDIATVEISSTFMAECGSIKVKEILTKQRNNMSKIKIDF